MECLLWTRLKDTLEEMNRINQINIVCALFILLSVCERPCDQSAYDLYINLCMTFYLNLCMIVVSDVSDFCDHFPQYNI